MLASTLFNSCMDRVLGGVADCGLHGASVGEVKATHLDFVDAAVDVSDSLKVLAWALEALDVETKLFKRMSRLSMALGWWCPVCPCVVRA